MDAIERAVPTPQVEIIVHRRARRQILRNGPLLASGAQDVHEPIDDLAEDHAALVPAALDGRDQRLDMRPFLVG
jgi:hypothetical protein